MTSAEDLATRLWDAQLAAAPLWASALGDHRFADALPAAEHRAMRPLELEVAPSIVGPQNLLYESCHRHTAENALGEAFDIRAFHDVLLGHGALPLRVLDDVVTRWLR